MKFFKWLFSRFAIITFLILLQLVCFILLNFYWIDKYAYISVFFVAAGFIIVLGIITGDQNPNLKIPWIVIIITIPPVGVLLYFLFGKTYVKRKERKMHLAMKTKQKEFASGKDVSCQLKEENQELFGQSQYIKNATLMPMYDKTELSYFKTGEEYFASLKKDMNNAKHFIFLEYFILSKGRLLDEVFSILKEKAKEGLDVRVIYDDMGSMKNLPSNFAKKICKEGIKCVKFNTYHPIAGAIYNNRDHRKIAIVDGYIAYTGGVNIADEYVNYVKKFGEWKDGGIRLYGEAAESFTSMYLTTYGMLTSCELRFDDFSSHKYHKEAFTGSGYVQPFPDGPAPIYKNPVGENVYLNMINQAKDYIYITTPYLIIDHLLTRALCLAAERGVDVKIITPGIPDKKIIFVATRDSYRRLLKSGVKIYEYTPGFMHAKCVLVDDEVAVLGTINFDYRSLVHHFECGCFIVKSNVICDIKDDFLASLKKAREPSKKNYQTKNIFKKILASILKFFAPLL